MLETCFERLTGPADGLRVWCVGDGGLMLFSPFAAANHPRDLDVNGPLLGIDVGNMQLIQLLEPSTARAEHR